MEKRELSPSEREWRSNFDALKHAIENAMFIERIARSSIEDDVKGWRPIQSWKADFVSMLDVWWGDFFGSFPSRDASSPFASFVQAAWHSMGDGLPDISWSSH